MDDEKHTPDEDWEMSVSKVSSSEMNANPEVTANNGGGWTMPEPIFRVSDGDKVEKSNNKPPPEAENTDDELPEYFDPQAESFILAQPDISEDFNTPEIPQQAYQPETVSAKGEKGNAKWLVLLGGIFVFFAVLVAVILGVYYFVWNK